LNKMMRGKKMRKTRGMKTTMMEIIISY